MEELKSIIQHLVGVQCVMMIGGMLKMVPSPVGRMGFTGAKVIRIKSYYGSRSWTHIVG